MAKNNVVMILSSDDGEPVDKPVWHLIDPCNSMGEASLCTGEFFGGGESAVEFEIAFRKITCPLCIEMIKTYKSVRL